MTILERITDLLKQANPDYTVVYEESSMMNIKADKLEETASFVHIEEFRKGLFINPRYVDLKRQVSMQLYFSKFTQFQNDAIERERLRVQIENEIVLPFIRLYKNSRVFDDVSSWGCDYPLPRFDANEVSVLLTFNCSLNIC